ncbi:hypothetical protein [Hymenobacter sp. DG25A]|uniref:hypothetical protein n=1 Tax=Hymenobacter sp. DG25A TaxID=1385663 RepID=UPI0006C8344D|nr:hypothetical protein [Hymenobacter sp. DG25A]
MKLFLKIIFSLLAFLIVSGIGGYFYARQKFAAPANQLTVIGLPAASSFVWLADTADKRAMPHAALLVPVKLANCPRTCYLQFDTGAPYSVLYAKPLAALQERYPATRRTFQLAPDTVRNFGFTIGEGKVQARKLKVLSMGTAEMPADTAAPFIIGTLGTDVLEGRALILDYGQRRFSLVASVPNSLIQQTDFVPMAFTDRRVLLTVGMQGKTQQLMFDSGASAFSLLTSRDNWDKLAVPGAPAHPVNVNSFGRTLTSYTAPTAAAMQLGNTAVPLQKVTHIVGTSMTQQLMMRFSGMGGMLGNEPFSTRTIILDTKGARFGVVRS